MARSRKFAKSVELSPQPDPRAPLDIAVFLKAAQAVLDGLTKDLLARADESPEITAALKARHAADKANKRTAETYAVWRRELVVQIAAAWLLSCVFVRTLEDRGLLARNRLAGPGALDAERAFTQLAPHLGPREYLLAIFAELDHFPAARRLFDREHNLAWRLAPSNEGAKALVGLFRGGDAEAPHFRFGQASTRFLGDLYQDLSEDVRKRYALLQTPDFVEAYILDRTLEPAIEQFGLRFASVIDPTCGSGHFLLGAFERLFDRWCALEPGESDERHVELALGSVYGADINPYAVFIAEFRLTLAAIEKLGVGKLREAPRLPMNLVVADSLLHGHKEAQMDMAELSEQEARVWRGDEFVVEDEREAKRILGSSYAAVVGNPPYITVKDKALRDLYRKFYKAAAGKYALSAPFAERFFELGCKGGFVGQITSNSFMKREFGKTLVQEVLPGVDLFSIVNTSGAYIPGHGTPTVMLFGRKREPVGDKVHAVLARRGEPSTPDDPAQGLVWSAIRDHGLEIGYEDDYVTVAEVEREQLKVHPWSLEGGGAGELKALLEERAETTMREMVDSIGFMAITGEDEAYLFPKHVLQAQGLSSRPFGIGEDVRDWTALDSNHVLFPYDEAWGPAASTSMLKWLWPLRSRLSDRLMFGKTQLEAGHTWWEYRHVGKEKIQTPLSIAFAFVATHNHFVLDRGGKVFKQSAPIIKLPDTATEDDHLALLAYLNSSTACFWMKQVFYPKERATGDLSTEKMRPEANRYEFAGTGLKPLPLPPWADAQRATATKLARHLDALATAFQAQSGDLCVDRIAAGTPADECIATVQVERDALEQQLVALQEQLDWFVYHSFGLIDAPVKVPDRITADERWFRTRDSERWSQLAPHANNKSLRTLEDPMFKRLWLGRQGVFGHGTRTLREEAQDAGRARLFANLERQLETPIIASITDLARRLTADDELARITTGLDLAINRALLDSESVPYLAPLRFTDAGLEKHAAWQHTWSLQRQEDAGEKVPEIPVPPKYDQKDFRDATYWRLRGKLDVPKERFISYPGLESDNDGQPIYGWAGWTHAQRAEALLALYNDRKDNEGWTSERLTPILVGIHELLPWIIQWHNEPDEDTGERLGHAFRDWLSEELRTHSLTEADLDTWRPAKKSGRTKKKAAAKPAGAKKSGRKKKSSTSD